MLAVTHEAYDFTRFLLGEMRVAGDELGHSLAFG